jgi:sugar phosphate isomerase/epimerase
MVKLSCLSVSLFPAILNGQMTIRQYADLCQDLKLDGFDLGVILLKNHTPKYTASIRKDMEDAGIRLAMITTYPDFTHPDAVQRRRELEYLRHDIALASDLGARFLRVTAGQAHPQTSVEDGVRWAIEGLRAAAQVADELGIQLLYEDHSKPGAWDYMDFSNPPSIFLRIAAGLRGASIGINFDTANILVAGSDDTLGVMDQVYDMIKTIHVAETATKGKMDPVAIGTGLAPIPEIFRYLKGKGFDGWLCLEEWGNQGEAGVRRAVDYVRKTWAEA